MKHSLIFIISLSILCGCSLDSTTTTPVILLTGTTQTGTGLGAQGGIDWIDPINTEYNSLIGERKELIQKMPPHDILQYDCSGNIDPIRHNIQQLPSGTSMRIDVPIACRGIQIPDTLWKILGERRIYVLILDGFSYRDSDYELIAKIQSKVVYIVPFREDFPKNQYLGQVLKNGIPKKWFLVDDYFGYIIPPTHRQACQKILIDVLGDKYWLKDLPLTAEIQALYQKQEDCILR